MIRVDGATIWTGTEEREASVAFGETITYVGPREGAPDADEVLDASGATLTPGLVDPHTHLVFGGSRAEEFARRMAGEDYRTLAAEGGGIASTVRATRAASEDALFANARRRALEMRARGVTTIEVKSGYGLDTETELRLLRVARRLDDEGLVRVAPTFLGAHTVPPERREDRARYVDEVISEQLPAVVEAGLATSCDVYCDDGAFTLEEARRILEAAKDRGLHVRAHAGQFADLGAADLVAELGGLSADHLEVITDDALRALADAQVVGVFLPGAWRTLRQEPPDGRRFRDAGVRVAVGTDCNPGTSPTTDLLLCASLAVRDAHLTIEEALAGVTVHAAAAIGRPDLGRLEVGAPADVALFDVRTPRALPYALGGITARRVWLGGAAVPSPLNAGPLW